MCGPLAFLQHFCLLFPSLFFWQDFLLRKLSRYQQLPPASRAWHRNTYTSEKPRGLIVGIRDTSVTLSGLNTPPGEILHPSSSADGSFVCQTSLKSAPSLASFQWTLGYTGARRWHFGHWSSVSGGPSLSPHCMPLLNIPSCFWERVFSSSWAKHGLNCIFLSLASYHFHSIPSKMGRWLDASFTQAPMLAPLILPFTQPKALKPTRGSKITAQDNSDNLVQYK